MSVKSYTLKNIRDLKELLAYVLYASKYKSYHNKNNQDIKKIESIISEILENPNVENISIEDCSRDLLVDCINFMLKNHRTNDEMTTYTGISIDRAKEIKRELLNK
jgi:hypothetical protein